MLGVCTTYHLDKRATGLRVCVMELEGQATVGRQIEGDGRQPNFKPTQLVSCNPAPSSTGSAMPIALNRK